MGVVNLVKVGPSDQNLVQCGAVIPDFFCIFCFRTRTTADRN